MIVHELDGQDARPRVRRSWSGITERLQSELG